MIWLRECPALLFSRGTSRATCGVPFIDPTGLISRGLETRSSLPDLSATGRGVHRPAVSIIDELRLT